MTDTDEKFLETAEANGFNEPEEVLSPEQIEVLLREDMSRFYADFHGFVKYVFPWGKKGGELEHKAPDKWQIDFMDWVSERVKAGEFNGIDPVKPIRKAIASGHGIGKSALVAWLILWIMCTRPSCRGTVTANTADQLQSRTWAELSKWMRRSLVSHWFNLTTSKGHLRMSHKANPEGWFCQGQTCKEENSDSFAGQHAEDSTSFYIFDEASSIPDGIWEVAEGGLTDGEPHIFAFGNPTKRHGMFFRAAFGNLRNLWHGESINSMDCKLPNKELFKEWIETWGWDSDFIRVRVRGLPPMASDLQFIDSQRIQLAQVREVRTLMTDPVFVGVDIARGGADNSVIYFRKGHDARSVPPIVIPGEFTRDEEVLVQKIVEVVTEGYMGLKPDIVCIDGTGVGGPIANRVRKKFTNSHVEVYEINFASRAHSDHCANMRAYMWWKMKEWLTFGMISDDERLEMDLSAPEYMENSKSQLLLESKKDIKSRGLASPDLGDALALTFAQYKEPKTEAELKAEWATEDNPIQGVSAKHDYDPLA